MNLMRTRPPCPPIGHIALSAEINASLPPAAHGTQKPRLRWIGDEAASSIEQDLSNTHQGRQAYGPFAVTSVLVTAADAPST